MKFERPDHIVYRTVDISHYGYLSHVPLLMAACMLTEGPILELGSGFGSSLALHGVCAVNKRRILSLESGGTWLAWLKLYSRKWHEFRLVEDFLDLPEFHEEDWELVLVDHGILGQRGLSLNQIRHIPIIIAHDTCHEMLNYTNEDTPQVLDSFKYRFDHQWVGPQTSALSDTVDVKSLFGGIGI